MALRAAQPAAGAADDGGAPQLSPRVACVAGFGPGISAAVARRFGRAGFRVALMARREERLEAGAEALRAAGVQARGYAVDLADPLAVRSGLARVAAEMGSPPEVLHWNPYNTIRTPLLEMAPEELDALGGVATKGLLAAVQALLPQWEVWAQQQPQAADAGSLPAAVAPPAGLPPPPPPWRRPALLVTGGWLGTHDPCAAAAAVEWGVEGIAIAKAAQHQLVAVLRAALAPRGVFVGQATVLGVVRGTAWDAVRSGEEGEGDVEEAGQGATPRAQLEAAAGAGKEGRGEGGDGAGSGSGGSCGGGGGGGEAEASSAEAEAQGGGEAEGGSGTVTPEEVAEALWRLYEAQPAGGGEWRVEVGAPPVEPER